jgi:hypothetical protein
MDFLKWPSDYSHHGKYSVRQEDTKANFNLLRHQYLSWNRGLLRGCYSLDESATSTGSLDRIVMDSWGHQERGGQLIELVFSKWILLQILNSLWSNF